MMNIKFDIELNKTNLFQKIVFFVEISINVRNDKQFYNIY